MNDKLNTMARTISEILKDADQAIDLQVLIDLWNEISNNKHKYPLVQIRFASEHIKELALKANGPDIAKGHFYHSLEEMCDF